LVLASQDDAEGLLDEVTNLERCDEAGDELLPAGIHGLRGLSVSGGADVVGNLNAAGE
jgi:hypothetical protein